MDTSDPMITFNEDGVCDHCINFYKSVRPNWHDNPYGLELLKRIVRRISSDGRGKDYDCILGLSGGLDSSYLLHTAVSLGLRPLVFHVDGGWNTDIAVSNIERLTSKLDVDLYVKVVDWSEMRDFQLALFKSGTPHLDIAQDHAFFATMYHFARKHGIRHILNGGNYSTECIRNPKEWIYYGTDLKFIRDIRARFGTVEMKSYPWSGILYHKVYLRYFRGIRVWRPLNYVPYRKSDAQRLLTETYGWKSYSQKHFESHFTKFYEGYWMPTRFGFDTRRVQFSSLIVTGQMNRDVAIRELELPSFDECTISRDFSFVANKLEITEDELWGYYYMEKKNFRDYNNQEGLFDLGARALNAFGAERAIKR
jgi:N-acetyl sugar amidotransferase